MLSDSSSSPASPDAPARPARGAPAPTRKGGARSRLARVRRRGSSRSAARGTLATGALLAAALISGCALGGGRPADTPGPTDPGANEPGAVVEADTAGNIAALGADPERAGEERHEPAAAVGMATDPELPWAERTLARLSLEEKVGQMIMPFMLGDFAPEGSAGHERLRDLVESQGIGGIIVSVGAPTDVAVKLNDLQSRADIPLLVAADLETGAGFRLRGAVHFPTRIELGGATEFPSLMAVGATGNPALAYQMGRITAIEARAVGIHVPFAPVLDVNNNPRNPIINTRSFGEDPEAVAELGAAFVRGIQEHGAIATGKHFPGHGDTGVDSHLALPVIEVSRARMDSVELVPFASAILAGLGGVMTAHISVPALVGEERLPATLSPRVLAGLLRDDLRFGGLVFTDAMDMNAIDRLFGREEAAVRAVEAGADVILMPPSPREAVRGIVAAVRTGRLPESRIDTSVLRILRTKESLGLHRNRLVDANRIPRDVGIPGHVAVAQEVARRSITVLRNGRDLLPLLGTRSAEVLSVSFRRPNDILAGKYFDAKLRSVYPRLVTEAIEPSTPASSYEALLRRARRSQLVVVSLYVTWGSYRGTVALPEDAADFIHDLAVSGVPHVIVSFGSPYLLSEIPDVQAYMLAWSGSEVSQRAAAEALFGEIAISGRTPTRVPPFHDLGEGLRIPRRVANGNGAGAEGENGLGAGENGRAQDDGDAPSDGDAQEAYDPLESIPVVEEAPASLRADAVGMDPAGLARVDSIVLSAIADSATPGAVLAVGRHGRLVRLTAYGRTDWAPRAPIATPHTLYDLASLTKVVGTTTAVMLLAQEGEIDLFEEVEEYLPWWPAGDERKEEVTVRDLLLHRSGLPPFVPFYRTIRGRIAYQRAVADVPLDRDPGEATVYSDLGFVTLGWIVEEVSGMELDDFLRERVWTPLGMDETLFLPDTVVPVRIAPTEVDTTFRNTHVHGVVHDENAFAMGGVAGHAGLFSTGYDLARFAEHLLAVRRLEISPEDAEAPLPPALIDPEVLRSFTTRAGPESSRALGWDTPSGRSSAGDYFTAKAFGHTGFTGTSIWIDPELDLYVVLLTNRVNPTRENSKHVALRRDVHDAVARAIRDQVVPRRPDSARGGSAGSGDPGIGDRSGGSRR